MAPPSQELEPPANPARFSLPAGVTVIGPAWSEGRPLPLAAPNPAGSDETALFCVGGHMAGLSLNYQIVGLGGRFLRAALTQPLFRLHALGDRPGLVRGGEGRVAGKVWALPTREIGALLAWVPAPLGFGAVLLDDGACLGFLAEAEGAAGTPDITALGGWRTYLAGLSDAFQGPLWLPELDSNQRPSD